MSSIPNPSPPPRAASFAIQNFVPPAPPTGALGRYARAAARERHDTPSHVLSAVPPAHVDLEELDAPSREGEGPREGVEEGEGEE